jgi:hypothetical protein
MSGALIGRRRRKTRPQQHKRFAEVGGRFVEGMRFPCIAGGSSEKNPQTEPSHHASFEVAD